MNPGIYSQVILLLIIDEGAKTADTSPRSGLESDGK